MAVHDVGIDESLAVSRLAGYVLGGATTDSNSSAVSAINEITFSTMATATLGATMPSLKCMAASVCGPAAGYAVGGYNTSDAALTGVNKFVLSTKTPSTLGASLNRTRTKSAGYSTGTTGYVVGGIVADFAGYVSKVTFATDALSESYFSGLDGNYARTYRPAVVSNGTVGYVCGNRPVFYYEQTTFTKLTDTTATQVGATLAFARMDLIGASSKTKGYVLGREANFCDILDFATETTTPSSGATIPSIYFSGINSCVGNGKAHFVGGIDLEIPAATSAMYSVAFATGTMSFESAALSTAVGSGAGLDGQETAYGGAGDSSTGEKTVAPKSGSTIEGSGSGAGFFSGGAGITGYSKRDVHRLRFDTETLELIYQDNFGQNAFLVNDGFGATSLVNGSDVYFLGGQKMTTNNPAVLETAYQAKFNALTLTRTIINGHTPFYCAGLSYNRFGAGFLVGHPVADSHLIYKYFYVNDTASSVYVAPVIGNELCGYNFGTDYGYIFGGNVDATRIFRINQLADSASILAAVLPSGRHRPASINLSDNGLIVGGQNADGSTKYATTDGFLGSTETARTSSATLGVARGGMGSVSGYTKGYLGSTFIPYTYTAQFVDSVAFATETSVQTALTLSLCGSAGASYTPANGFGAADTKEGVGSMATDHTAGANPDSTQVGSVPHTTDISATADAGAAQDMISVIVAVALGDAAADAQPVCDMIAVLDIAAEANATAVVFVSGIDINHGEGAAADSTQTMVPFWSVSHTASGIGQADISATNDAVLDATAGATAGEASVAEKPVYGELTGAGSANTSQNAAQAAGVSIGEAALAQELIGRIILFESSNPALAAADPDATRIGPIKAVVEAASAADVQVVTASIYNASIIGGGVAGEVVAGFMMSFAAIDAVGSADTTQTTTHQFAVGRQEDVSAGATQAVSTSYAVASSAQCAALDQALVTGVLTVQASEALAAIVSAYVALLGEGIKPDQHFVVAKVGAQYIVSKLDKHQVLTSVGRVAILTGQTTVLATTQQIQEFVTTKDVP